MRGTFGPAYSAHRASVYNVDGGLTSAARMNPGRYIHYKVRCGGVSLNDSQDREQWASRTGFILATVGSAVGLGNVWRFPTIVARSGGGAFLLLYLVIVLGVGIPLMMSELAMGRRSQRGVVGAFRDLSPGTGWWGAGLVAPLAVFLIASYYSVIAGWTLIFTLLSAVGGLSGLGSDGLTELFAHLTADTLLPVYGQGAFLILASVIVFYGVSAGIERWGRVLTPGIVVLLLVLLGRVLLLEGGLEGAVWFLTPNFADMSFDVALDALGQVFFSFSLGMGAVLTYGSYLSRRDDIPINSLIISLADVGIAILAGLVVISALFAFGIEAEAGFGLVFIALPAVFNTLPGAVFWSTVFFLSLSFAAMTSIISFLEVLNALLIEEMGWSRPRAVVTVGVSCFFAGIPSALSEGLMRYVRILGWDIMGFTDMLTSNLILPLSGLLTTVFVAWIWGTRAAGAEVFLGVRRSGAIPLWSFIMRYIAPLALTYILIAGLLF